MKASKKMFLIDLITLMPEMFEAFTNFGVVGRGFKKKFVDINYLNPRDFTADNHKTVDDKAYGGGPGMVMMLDPLIKSIESARTREKNLGIKKRKVVHLTPKGSKLNHEKVKELSKESGLILLASRYEGVDERLNNWIDEEISIGDFVTSGGELPAMLLMDALIRQIPGVLNDIESANQDSFVNGLLDHPSFTRPESTRGLKVPDILLSGDHEKIRIWRLKESLKVTKLKRPDLLINKSLTNEESRLLKEIEDEQEQD
jgi:tRNA (guanine37-N1)-methyltransferase